jgi:quinol monooxygenase YgiN
MGMFLRLLRLTLRPAFVGLMCEFYTGRVMPALRDVSGCRFAGLLQSRAHPTEVVSMTIWDSPAAAEAYSGSPVFAGLVEAIRRGLADAAEWKVRLTEELQLEVDRERLEPAVTGYVLASDNCLGPAMDVPAGRSYLRLVALKVAAGRMAEIRQIYRWEIIPTLLATPGCRCACLLDSIADEREVVSVTVWDSREDADRYERSGQFTALMDRLRPALTGLYRWKLSLERESAVRISTSEDAAVDGYALVVGERFD